MLALNVSFFRGVFDCNNPHLEQFLQSCCWTIPAQGARPLLWEAEEFMAACPVGGALSEEMALVFSDEEMLKEVFPGARVRVQ